MRDWFPLTKNWIQNLVTSNYIGTELITAGFNSFRSHPVGLDGQNHIVAVTPLKFLPAKEFKKRQKSINSKLALTSSMLKIKDDIIEKKKRAKAGFQIGVKFWNIKSQNEWKCLKILFKELKEKGNVAFQKKKFDEAETCYSNAIQLNMGSRVLWTNRAKCRNTIKKHEGAISDCDSALSINPKCTSSIEQKGKALMWLGRFDEAITCFESLRLLGENTLADTCLTKLNDIQERVEHFLSKINSNHVTQAIFHPNNSSQNQLQQNAQDRRKKGRKIKSKRQILYLRYTFVIDCFRNTDNNDASSIYLTQVWIQSREG